jgi:saccharopine dehydrogenase-like NADP-dependent oxidoreductase
MPKIAIVGAGRIGTAVSKILLTVSDYEIVLIDNDEEALKASYVMCSDLQRPEFQVAVCPTIPVETYTAYGRDQLEATLRSVKADVIVHAAPSDLSYLIAEIVSRVGGSYIDFSENSQLADLIHGLNVPRATFVPQTGLAPGFISYIGLSLFESLGTPKKLELRAGVLPQVSFGPGHFAITSNVPSLLNEYTFPVRRKTDGLTEEIQALDDHEFLTLNGTQYEAFTTAGGLGSITSYGEIPNVQFKTLRFPGHLEYIQKLFARASEPEDLLKLFSETFETTADDIVVLAAHATDTKNRSSATCLSIYPSEALQLTASELTIAGVGVGIIQLMLSGDLPSGVLTAAQIPFDALLATAGMQLVFEHIP